MPLRLELKASATGPGYAQLTIAGWNQDAGSIELSVQRNQDGRFLDESGEWTTNPVWHDVSILEKTDTGLSGEMGPWLVDPLVKNPQVAYMFELRSPDHKDKGVLRIMGQILSSQAAGNSLNPEARTRPQNVAPVVKPEPPTQAPAPPPPPPAPTPEPSQLEPTQVKTPEPEPSMSMKFGMQAINDGTVVQKKPDETSSTSGYPPHRQVDESAAAAPKKRSMLPLYLTLLGLLLLVGGGAAWYLGLFSAGVPGAGGSAASSGACGEEAMKGGDDLAFVQGCLKSSPSSEQVLAVIAAAKKAKLCNIAQRLYAYKAQGGDARIALAYAHEYDPDSFEAGGCIESADGETAAYWYEIVVNHDPNNAEAKQRLEKLGK